MPPHDKKELQRFLGQVNYIRRFISNCAGRTQIFSSLLKLRKEEEFAWREEHQQAFDDIKRYLANPPVLNSPIPHQPLKLYLSATNTLVACLLARDNDLGNEQAVYYLSKLLNEAERKYSHIERLCLALFFACMKLWYYLMPVQVQLICKTDLIKYMLS
ncbi:Retrovirus-related Pol polyprotein from transposon opus, partial [Linum perenne]